MGNTQSITNNNIDLKNTVDTIASKYILSQKFQDLINLKDKNYCKNLVILTSKILNNNLNRQQITYLAQYQQGDKIIYKLDNDDVLYFENEELDKIDEQNSIKKNRMCIGISAFYLKINYIFSAILTTLKPIALIKDNDSDELDTVAADVDNFENETNEESLKPASESENKNSNTSEQTQEISDPNNSENITSLKISEGGSTTNNVLSKFDLLSSDNSIENSDKHHEDNIKQSMDNTLNNNLDEEGKHIDDEMYYKKELSDNNNIIVEKTDPTDELEKTDPTDELEKTDPTDEVEKTDPTNEVERNTEQQNNRLENNDSYFNVETTKNSTLPSNDNKILLGFISINSLCGKRIANLMNINSNFNIENFDIQKYDSNLSSEININPTVCGNKHNLQDEVGIPELERLYYDLFNFKFGTFNSMSQSAEIDYNNDLLEFYNVFTGSSLSNVSELKNQNPPITKFSDIQVDYENILKNTCAKYDNKKNISGRSRDFREYAVRLQLMIKNTKVNQDKLLDILNQLFYVKRNNYPIEITVNKNLNNQSLDKLLVETRLLIKNMYIQCDKDYRNVLRIFQIIVDKLELTTLTRQEDQMNNLSETSIKTQENTESEQQEDDKEPELLENTESEQQEDDKEPELLENTESEQQEDDKEPELLENTESEQQEDNKSPELLENTESKQQEDDKEPELLENKPSKLDENEKTSNDSQLNDAKTEINFDKNKNSEQSKGGKYKKTKTNNKKYNKKSKKVKK